MAGIEGDPAASVRAGVAGAGAGQGVDLTAAAGVPPEIVAGSLADYMRGWWQRVRSGDSGVLPVIVAIAAVAIVFEIITTQNSYLRPSNVVYIFSESSVYMLLAMAEIFILLLGEIDLSIGAVALLGGTITFKLVQQDPGPAWPWWLAILVTLACCGLIGGLQGTLVARLKIPSFVVTLGGYLVFAGIDIVVLGGASAFLTLNTAIPNQAVVYDLASPNLTSAQLIPPVTAWIVLAVLAAGFGAFLWVGTVRRRRSGVVAAPFSLTALRIALVAAVGAAVVAICSVDRGSALVSVEGVPWAIPIVLGILGAWTVLLQRTRFGRYVYAIGGNPEAARRAGVNLARIRTLCFVLSGMTAGFAGVMFGSFFGGYSSSVGDPGQLLLYAVAAAVIGGTSLFGGRGKAIHGILGGLVIGGIAYGVVLMNLGDLSTPLQYILPGAVLLAAVLIDVLSRRGARTGSVARV